MNRLIVTLQACDQPNGAPLPVSFTFELSADEARDPEFGKRWLDPAIKCLEWKLQRQEAA